MKNIFGRIGLTAGMKQIIKQLDSYHRFSMRSPVYDGYAYKFKNGHTVTADSCLQKISDYQQKVKYVGYLLRVSTSKVVTSVSLDVMVYTVPEDDDNDSVQAIDSGRLGKCEVGKRFCFSTHIDLPEGSKGVSKLEEFESYFLESAERIINKLVASFTANQMLVDQSSAEGGKLKPIFVVPFKKKEVSHQRKQDNQNNQSNEDASNQEAKGGVESKDDKNKNANEFSVGRMSASLLSFFVETFSSLFASQSSNENNADNSNENFENQDCNEGAPRY